MDSIKIQELEFLAENLVSDALKEHEIKVAMEKLGLEYSDDPVERLNRILRALHPSVDKVDDKDFL